MFLFYKQNSSNAFISLWSTYSSTDPHIWHCTIYSILENCSLLHTETEEDKRCSFSLVPLVTIIQRVLMCPEHCSLLFATCWKAAANCTVVEKECSDSGQKPSSPRKCCVLLNVYTEQANLFYLAVSRDTSEGLMPRQKPEFCFSSSKGQKAWINHWYRSWNPEESAVFQT